MLKEPTLAEFVDVHQLADSSGEAHDAALAKVRSALSKLASATGGRFFDIEDENAMAAFLSTFLSTYQPEWSLATEDAR